MTNPSNLCYFTFTFCLAAFDAALTTIPPAPSGFMKLKQSLVSVIMPVYKAERFLPHCLDSLAKQSYTNLEIIAVNDKSNDNSLKILKQFRKKHKNIQILNNKKHYGLAVCLNRALRSASGQFLTMMNAFDFVPSDKFKIQVNYLSMNPKVVAVGSQYVTVNENNKTLQKSNLPQVHEDIYKTLLRSISLKPETIMINRLLIPKDILYFTTNKYPLIFTEVLIKLLQYGKIANLRKVLYHQRIGIRRYRRRANRLSQSLSFLQLLLKSRSVYDYRPPLLSSLPAMFR